MAKPSQKPRWADTTSVNITEPASGLKDVGYATGAEPAAEEWNWLINRTWQWIEYLDNIHTEEIEWQVNQIFLQGISTETTSAAHALSAHGSSTGRAINALAHIQSGSPTAEAGLFEANTNAASAGDTVPANMVIIRGAKGANAQGRALQLKGGSSHASGLGGKAALEIIGGDTYTNSGEGTTGVTQPEPAVVLAAGKYVAGPAVALSIYSQGSVTASADAGARGIELLHGNYIGYVPVASADFNEAKGLISPISTAAFVLEFDNTLGSIISVGEYFNWDGNSSIIGNAIRFPFINDMIDTFYHVQVTVRSLTVVPLLKHVTKANSYVELTFMNASGTELVPGSNSFSAVVTIFGRHAV